MPDLSGMKSWRSSKLDFRSPLFLVIVLVAVTLAVLVLSPALLLLTNLLFPLGDKWSVLSDIGQSFGGVAAVFSAVALVAVAYSVQVQSRQVFAQRVEAVTAQQRELVFKLLDNPALGSVLNQSTISEADTRKNLENSYRNLWFMYLYSAYRLEEVSEAGIRRSLRSDLFTSQAALDYWESARAAFQEDAGTERERSFVATADQAFHEMRETLRDQNEDEP